MENEEIITISEIDDILKVVLKEVRELEPVLMRQYEQAVTPWLIRTVLHKAQSFGWKRP